MNAQRFQWDHMTMGVCYYPEHWPKNMWGDDIRRMKDAGIETLRAGEFSWAIIEPEEGRFCFDLFDEFLDLCEREGMRVIFGTPTATPPAWLTERYPECLNALRDGTLLRHGARRHYNYNSETYRRLTARVVTAMAQHFGPHPAIVGWQIDNELNCETDEFHSEADHAAFRVWLEKKYTTLDHLNEAWGTVFWSETYTAWDQLHAPRPVLNGGYNPHLLLDYSRFVSDSCIAFAAMQADILRKYIKPGDFITTNGLFGNLDNHALARDVLDVYTYDSYPNFAFGLDRDPKRSIDLNDRKWSRNLAETRSVCPHFGIMEQQSGAGGWSNRMEMPAPRPGQLTLWAMQSVAHGADFVSFFRWRTCTFGTEMYWHGILDYDNRDNRKLAEVRALSDKFGTIDEVCGAAHEAAFTLITDYDNMWDTRCDAWHRRIQKHSEAEIFAASQLSHTPYDLVNLTDETDVSELAACSVAIYPHPVIMTEARARVLEEYVRRGGTLVIGCRAGLKDAYGRCVMQPQPGLLGKLTGTLVSDFTLTSPAEDETFATWDAANIATPVFNDVLEPMDGTRVLATYGSSYYRGSAAMCERMLGKGRVIHLGSAFDREAVRRLFEYTGILEAPFRGICSAPEGVELVKRVKDGRAYVFALNYQPKPQAIVLKKPCTMLYTGESAAGEAVLPPFGTAVYRVEQDIGNA